jgi:F0F1-type ATP synthase membrane subunit b/b'
MNQSSDLLHQFEQERNERRREYENTVRAIAGDDRLSEQGKIEARAKAQATAREKIDEILSRARDRISEMHTTAQENLASEHQSRAEGARNDLTSAVYADLLRRQIEGMEPKEMLDAYRNAPTDFDKQVISMTASAKLKGRELEELRGLTGAFDLDRRADNVKTIARDLARVEDRLAFDREEKLKERFKLNG